MCLATPMQLISRAGSWAIVKSANHQHRVNVDLIPDVKIGDFVIAHADLAIGIVSKEEAENMVELNCELEENSKFEARNSKQYRN